MEKKVENASLRDTVKTYLRAIRLIEKLQPGTILPKVLSGMVSGLFGYVSIYPTARLVDELAGQRRLDVLLQWALILTVSVTLCSLLAWVLRRWMNAKDDSFYGLRHRITGEKLLDMDYAIIDSQITQEKYNEIKQNQDWKGWGWETAMWGIFQFSQHAFHSIVAIALLAGLVTAKPSSNTSALAFVDHPVTLVAMLGVFIGVLFLQYRLSKNYIGRMQESDELKLPWGKLKSALGDLGAQQQRGMDIRIYRQQELTMHYLEKGNIYQKNGINSIYARKYLAKNIGFSDALSPLMTGVVYVYVCLKAVVGSVTVGGVTQYVSTMNKFVTTVTNLMYSIRLMRQNTPYLQKMLEFLDIPNAMYQGSLTTEKRNDRKYDVEFRDVSFKYPGSDNWALRHVSMRFQVGRRLAIVGENGSGKTTFIKLLCRLYDPQEGEILLNGIDIRKYNYRQYMDIFAVVFQDFQLLSQPLGANVAGSMDYDRERVRKALVDAGFGDRLDSLPDGLDTQLYKEFGENGVEVSSGEAQKIAIARALYKDAPFIILDEPTAALDPIAEAEIYSKFNDIVGDKTAIYISHRLSSCKFCDEIAVFHEGAVIQQGSHEDLLSDTDGKYSLLWNAQAQYYTEQSENG